jgi:alpha-galactosidase
MLRAADCPGDIVANRIRIADLRLSSGTTAVHGDMLRWDYNESVESAAKQLLAVLYSVPQISVKFKEIPLEHQEMIRYRLDFYKKHLNALVKGKFIPFFPDMNYPLLRGESTTEAISTVYVNFLKVSCSKLASNFKEIVVNASCSSEVLVDLPCNAMAVIHDCSGREVKNFAVNAGLSAIEVPISGDVEFTVI